MRGCLFVLVLAAAVVAAASWFGAPVLASTVARAALENAGFRAATSTITVTADPPPRILLGRADRLRIVGADVDFRTFHAASLDLVLTDVDLLGRRAATIRGTIEGAELATSDGPAATADVAIDGSADAAAATIDVGAAAVNDAVAAAFRRRFGVAVIGTELAAPDILRIRSAGSTIEGRLGVDATGSIVLTTALGSSEILSIDRSFPLTLRSVSVVDGNLRIAATLDAQALLGG